MNIAGLPATTVHGSTSFATVAVAATTAPAPIVTPGITAAFAAIQTFDPIVIGLFNVAITGEEVSCEAVQMYAS